MTVENAMLWNPGETLELRASGDVVPAFSRTLTAPDTMQLDPSMLPDSGVLTVSPDVDLTVKWTSSCPEVTVTLMQYPAVFTDFRTSLRVVCELPGSGGQGIIPKEAVSALSPSASYPGLTQINYGCSTSEDVKAGGYDIRAYAVRGAFMDIEVTGPGS